MLYLCIFCIALSMDLFVLRVCQMFGETIRIIFGVVVIECYGSGECGWRCSVG